MLHVYEDRKLLRILRRESRLWLFRAMCAVPLEIVFAWATFQVEDRSLFWMLMFAWATALFLHGLCAWWAVEAIIQGNRLRAQMRRTV